VAKRGRRHPGAFGVAVASVLDNERRDVGLTQSALGAMVGISQSQLSLHLNGVSPITIDELADISHALGLTVTQVVIAAAGVAGESSSLR
jgi:transcriptional regulator with XRE-family HTH domain